MKKRTLFGVLTTSLSAMLLGSMSVRADFLQETVVCPTATQVLVEADGVITITDIILSANKNTSFALGFSSTSEAKRLMTVFLEENGTVVSNFQGEVSVEGEQALFATCEGEEAIVTVTVVGNVQGDLAPDEDLAPE